MEKQTAQFDRVADAIIDYCGIQKILFLSPDGKTALLLNVDRDRPTPENSSVNISDEAWSRSREVVSSHNVVPFDDPPANARAIAHVPLIICDA